MTQIHFLMPARAASPRDEIEFPASWRNYNAAPWKRGSLRHEGYLASADFTFGKTFCFDRKYHS